MRFLNKIIFINSAKIPYAEISLNGNVHFIGTQGVGKSTILRAILYFYNADGRKLGVPTGPTNKNFVEYYLPTFDSYIVYEIQKETGPFCLMAFNTQNRAGFRFFDGPYNKNHFIKNDTAYDNWGSIRAVLDMRRIHYSKTIKSNSEYLDIIYGNVDGKREFKRYSLLESKQYKNIPLTIQNVFLNTKLDADFIKQTIISSMGEMDIPINLQNYSHHLSNFETQLSDIRHFGFPSVQKHAHEAAKLNIAIRQIGKKQKDLASELFLSLKDMELRFPVLNDELLAKQNMEKELKGKKQSEINLFNGRKDKILAKINVIDDKLKQSKKAKEKYQRMNIEGIIERVGKLGVVALDKENLLKEKNLLTAKFTEISQKYEALSNELTNQLNNFRNLQEKQKLGLIGENHKQKNALREKYEELYEDIRKQHKTELDILKDKLGDEQNKTYQLKIEKNKITYKNLYETEIQNLKDQISQKNSNLNNAKNNKELAKSQIETLQRKWDLETKSINQNFQAKLEKLEERNKKTKNKILEIEQKIKNSENSFYAWLNQNQKGWENNIGKVCDEEVLFSGTLSPSKSGKPAGSFFGVDIDLDEIDKTVKTTEYYNFEKQKLELEATDMAILFAENEQNQATELDKAKARNLPKIRELKNRLGELGYNIELDSKKLEELAFHLNDTLGKAKNEKQKMLETIQTQIETQVGMELDAKEKLAQTENQILGKIISKKRELKSKLKAMDTQLAEKTEKIEITVKNKEKETQTKKNNIEGNKKEELKNKGANTKRIQEIEDKIGILDAELGYIENNRDKVAEYNKDKAELFDKEKEFINSKNLASRELENMKAKHEQLLASVGKELQHLANQIEKIENQLKEIISNQEEFEAFKKSEIYQSIEISANEQFKENQKPRACKMIVDELKEGYYSNIKKTDELKQAVDKFLGNFSEQNIFKFKLKLIELKEYVEFTDQLTEFIEEDKISEYEKRVNERFADILQLIGGETSQLLSKAGEIQNIINKINRDFMAKNFVGAVKKIELKFNESENKIFVILKLIKEFNDENTMDLGKTNLFSSPNKELVNKKAIDLLKQLVNQINLSKKDNISLSDSFELKFRVEENQNDTGWVEKLANVGSDGTDVLVKAMVNIMLLNVFKEGASKRFKDFSLHCMMDEIGKLHPNNVRGILKFANERNIFLINGSPTENTPLTYRHIYKLAKDENSNTLVQRIISNQTPSK